MLYRDSSFAEDVFETYWFEKNLQGDIVAVYDAAGTKLISYAYDAWGNFATTYHNDCTSSNPANFNPYRYRGYYYDAELEMYYLQSRYYDPVIGRFINPDKYIFAGQGFVGYNMFAYCLNNPVANIDKYGTDATVFQVWTSTMWWLCGADTVLPIGDIVYVAGVVVTGVIALATIEEAAELTYSARKKHKGQDKDRKPPEVKFPEGDPAEPPGEEYEWKGKGPKGGSMGAWVNKVTGEQWHPDLNHPAPKGPHWDYTDIFGVVWSVFADGRVLIWEG